MEAHLLRTQRLESLGRLAGGIAHDLNNILSPMLMAPPLLRDALRDPAALELVDIIESSALRGAAIIRQLLTFALGAEGDRVPVQLRSLARDMLQIVTGTFPKNITARLRAAADCPLVDGDATQLHQVLMNLCVNARDAMPDGGTLTLTLETADVDAALARVTPDAKPGRYLVLRVADTGAGIPPENLERIFDPFFTTKKVGEGTGLGLSTALGIVRGHGGFVRVDSTPGRGTEFGVYLPVSAQHAREERPPAGSPSPRGSGDWVLLVDDEDGVRRVTRQTLEEHGYRVLEARNGAEALAAYAAHREPVRAVVTDLMMPAMDGPRFIRALRERDPRVAIITVSGQIEEPAQFDALRKTTQAFLQKPLSAAALLDALHTVLHAG